MSAHHLKLNKMELLFLPGKALLLKELSMFDNATVSPSQSAKNLGVTLSFSKHQSSDPPLQVHALQHPGSLLPACAIKPL